MGAGVDVAAVGAAGGREVAPDERFEDAVAAEGDERAVVWVRLVVVCVVEGEAVVEVCCIILPFEVSEVVLVFLISRKSENLPVG